MPDAPTITAPDATAHPAELATAPVLPVKPGWKTSEFWIHVVLMGGLTGAGATLIGVLSSVAAKPDASPVLVVAVSALIPALGLLLKAGQADYMAHRKALKLDGDS